MSAISPIVQQMRGPLDVTPQETAQQNKAAYLAAGKETSRAMGDSLTGENSLEVPAGNDTVTISEEARTMRQRMAEDKEAENKNGPDGETAPGAKESVHTGVAGAVEGEEMSAAERARETILKQIKAVREKIEQAKQRLAEVSATNGADGAAAAGSSAQAPSAEGKEAAVQAVQGMGNAMGGAAESEAIQAEIKILEQQLQTLYSQLQNSASNGGGSAATGTAGIGGASNGPSGQGERISVSA
ncbi:conserved hypothetical protein [uncultured delta proteobacterium]|uniref:FlxA-like protein n=1 Tax=uncultured delta proteobacterium TaxID=34034 RepID=A0A212JGA9_9DELT|nr:conserved hypothetical protein [uncultured delta proteobacterium]